MCAFAQWTLNFGIIQCHQFTTRWLCRTLTLSFTLDLKSNKAYGLYCIFFCTTSLWTVNRRSFSLCPTLLQIYIQSCWLALTIWFLPRTIIRDRWSTNQPTHSILFLNQHIFCYFCCCCYVLRVRREKSHILSAHFTLTNFRILSAQYFCSLLVMLLKLFLFLSIF